MSLAGMTVGVVISAIDRTSAPPGGLAQIKAMRDLADAALRAGSGARPLTLVTGYGDVLGKWVITEIEEEQPTIGPSGTPIEQRLRLTLAAYGEDMT